MSMKMVIIKRESQKKAVSIDLLKIKLKCLDSLLIWSK